MIHFTVAQLSLLVGGLLAHLFGDWFLQDDWLARNKHRFRHPAAWLHAATHGGLAYFVFGPVGAGWVFGTHFLIDLRWPLALWSVLVQQSDHPTLAHEYVEREGRENPVLMHLQIWRDQAAHVLVIALLAYCLGR